MPAPKNAEKRGMTTKENIVMRAFWGENNMDQMMLLAGNKLDEVIDEWLAKYQARQIKRIPTWWYPNIQIKTLNQVRNTRTDIDKGWHL